MRLSDGETQFMAFELKRIVGLGSEEVKLGTKVRFFITFLPLFPRMMLTPLRNSSSSMTFLPSMESSCSLFRTRRSKAIKSRSLSRLLSGSLRTSFDEGLSASSPLLSSPSFVALLNLLSLQSMEPLPHPDLEPPAADRNDDLAPKPDDDDDVYMQAPSPPPPRQPSAPHQPVASNSRTKPALSSSASKTKPNSKPARASSEEFDDDFDYDALVAQGAFDDAGAGGGGGEGGADEDEEEAMRAMMEDDFGGPPPPPPARRYPPQAQPKRPAPPSKPSSRAAVKPEPSSSSSHTAQARSSTLSGTVEVLELDSSSDEEGGAAKENSRPAPPAKKAKVVATRVKEELSLQAAGGARGGGRTVTMLELDDSD
jgi:hypothetical protein